MSTLEVNKITPSTGTSITLGDSGDTFTIPSGVTITNNGTQSGFGGNNTPFFFGTKASDQTLTRGVETKITGFTNDEIDTNSSFDGTTFTVPSGGAGKYFFNVNLFCDFTSIGSDGELLRAKFYYNGSASNHQGIFRTSGSVRNVGQCTINYSFIKTIAVGDTIEVYSYLADGDDSGNGKVSASASCFMGFKLVE